MNVTTLFVLLCWVRLRYLSDHAEPEKVSERVLTDVFLCIAFFLVREISDAAS